MPSESHTADYDFTVPTAVYSITVTLEGEAGEEDSGFDQPDSGDGGYVEGDLSVQPGDTLYIRKSSGGAGQYAYVGGDSIDIRTGGTSLSDRVAVAAGGGAAARDTTGGGGGDGGALTGEDGERGDDGYLGAGSGGSQTSGGAGGEDSGGSSISGSDGQFGSGGDSGFDGGGGGAGWYGGGGGGASDSVDGAGGGGGSNYVDGLSNVPYNGNERGGSNRDFGQGGLATLEWEPASVGNLSVSTNSDTSLSLNWSPPDGFDPSTYYIDRSTYDGGYSQIATSSTTDFTDSGLPQARGITTASAPTTSTRATVTPRPRRFPARASTG
ncbi:fibronectin type III domain-containing protein [Halorubrum saccharovorum]|uniref:fibronectin type III domain-containing protein n=1 Tax=Halorubrum saccharovorum TaxID=2248 RepID=UPI00128C454C|nr:fibronectin type III domain-containing protein [Halorubrum saccharovorum]